MSGPSTRPVLVVHGDNVIGLTVVRALGQHGIPVAALVSGEGIARSSRYCWRALLRPAPECLAGAVENAIRECGISHVFCTSEDAIVELNRHRERLAAMTQLMFPPPEVFDRALDKAKTLDIARRVGVPVPVTVAVARTADLEHCRELSYPVVVKPRGNGRVRFAFKSLRVASHAELVELMKGFEPEGEFPLVQEFIPGKGVGVEALMHEGRVITMFQHRRIRENPPSGGASCYCESTPPDPELARHTTDLLRAMEWPGVAMVEFRRDPDTGRVGLMEVNGRFWGSIPLAIHAGVNFPYLWYQTTFGDFKAAEPAVPYRTRLRCRAMSGDTQWLLAVLRGGHGSRVRAMVDYLLSFRPSTRYFVWRASDPLPAVMNTIRLVPVLVRRVFAAARAKTS